MKIIDLRSDTVTRPSKEMLEAMMTSKTGDDVFNEDPTINELQEYSAQLFGKEAALFCSSGTQTNQIAINTHTTPGGEVICHYESHVFKYEGGGIAKNSGASIRTIGGDRGRITSEEIETWINPVDDVHYPLTQLVSIEDTSNRGGGAIYNFKEILKIKEVCNKHSLGLHLDGARVFNALIQSGMDFKEYGKPFDSISICLSKGLGAPVGSLLLGNKEFIQRAHRARKVLGGGMRQAGIIAGGGLYALKNNIKKLKKDHFHAQILESVFKKQTWISAVIPVETNIVVVELIDEKNVVKFIEHLKESNILSMKFGKNLVRMVTHLDISESDIHFVTEIIKKFKG